MGGEIEIEDTPGGGLTMVLAFKAIVTRVLVVDDEPQILRGLGTNLRARGYEVETAVDGERALELAARVHPDVVILDLGLPGIDGVDVIRGLRAWTTIPIIVLSARDQERDKVQALDAGADDYVSKPFGMDELLARLRAAERRAAPAGEEAVVVTEGFTVDLAAKRVSGGGRRPSDADRVAPGGDPGPPPRQARQPATAAAGGLGSEVRGRDELPPRVHGADPAEARARSRAPPLLHHRAGHGLSLRAEGVVMRPSSRRIAGFALATAGTAALTVSLLPFRDDITPLSNGFVFLTLVVVTVAIGGLGAGIMSSFISFLAFNFFFIPPYGTFAIGRGDDVVVLFVFLGLSVLVSVLMARATSRAEAAEARERELRTLQDLSRALVERGPDPESYAVVVKLAISRLGFRDGALFIQPRADATGLDELVVVNAEPGSVPLSAEGPGIERQALNIGSRNLGVLVLRGDRLDISGPERRVLRAFSDQLALVLERDRMLRVATEAS